MKKLILAVAALTVAVIGFGGLKASTTYAEPSNVWVINGNVANFLNAGAVTWTAAGLTDANVADFGDWAEASAGQISSDPANAGNVYIVVKTDGSTTAMSLNGRGLTCSSVVGGTLGVICDGTATETPAAVDSSGQFVIWQVTDVNTFADGSDVTAKQNDVTVDSEALSVVGGAHDIDLVVTKPTIQEGAASCELDDSTAAPTRGGAAAIYTDINGNALVGYPTEWGSSDDGVLDAAQIGDTAADVTTSMLLSDGSTIAAPNVYCGDEPGTADLEASNFVDGAIDGVATQVTRSEEITVTGVPASIALTASPAAIACDGTATSTVTAKVTDSEGNNVVDNTNVNFSVVALGTANPINTKTTDGEASSTITPLSGATAGVTVIVTSGDAQASIRVDCSLPTPVPPAPSPTAGTGTIGGPDTGSGGYLGQDGSAGIPVWTLVALALGSLVLVGGGMVTRRSGK